MRSDALLVLTRWLFPLVLSDVLLPTGRDRRSAEVRGLLLTVILLVVRGAWERDDAVVDRLSPFMSSKERDEREDR